jgi:hypothetical protein
MDKITVSCGDTWTCIQSGSGDGKRSGYCSVERSHDRDAFEVIIRARSGQHLRAAQAIEVEIPASSVTSSKEFVLECIDDQLTHSASTDQGLAVVGAVQEHTGRKTMKPQELMAVIAYLSVLP